MNRELHPSARSQRGSLHAYSIATMSLLLLLALGAAPARAGLEIVVGSGLVDPGDSVDIPVSITTDVSVVAVHLDVSFDPTYLSVGSPVAGDVFDDHQVVSHVSSEGVLRMVVYSLTNGTLGTGTLVTLPFSVDPASPEGTYFLRVTAATIADGSYSLASDVFVVVRTDTPTDSTTLALRDWLLADEGQQTVANSGYVPLP